MHLLGVLAHACPLVCRQPPCVWCHAGCLSNSHAGALMIKKADRLRLGFFDCILNIFIYFRQKNNENSSSREISRCQSAAGEFLTMELLTTTVANYSSSPGTVKCMFKTNVELKTSLRQEKHTGRIFIYHCIS